METTTNTDNINTTTNTDNKDTDNTVIEENKPKLSKNQQKRLIKDARWEEIKEEKKKYLREKKKENLKKRKELMTSEEKLERSRLKQLKKKNEFDNLEGHIIFDFESSDLMGEKEKRSLVTQMTFLHGFNKVSNKPMNLYATGVNSEMKAMMEKSSPMKMLSQSSEPYIERFKDCKDQLVYLTAESENVIHELDLSKKYIIGAIVDHNRLKGHTFEKAKQQGIAHAQLPIGDYIQMASRKVLAVNHVFQIINQFLVLGNWKDAFEKVIPKRKFEEMGRQKRSKLKNKSSNDNDDGSNDESDDDEGEEQQDDNNEEQSEDINNKKIKLDNTTTTTTTTTTSSDNTTTTTDSSTTTNDK